MIIWNKEKIPSLSFDFLVCAGRCLRDETGVWFGAIDVQNGLRAMMRAECLKSFILIWDEQGGLVEIALMDGLRMVNVSDQLANHLNVIAGSLAVTGLAVRNTIAKAMQSHFDLTGGGVILVWYSPERGIELKTAAYLGERALEMN